MKGIKPIDKGKSKQPVDGAPLLSTRPSTAAGNPTRQWISSRKLSQEPATKKQRASIVSLLYHQRPKPKAIATPAKAPVVVQPQPIANLVEKEESIHSIEKLSEKIDEISEPANSNDVKDTTLKDMLKT